ERGIGLDAVREQLVDQAIVEIQPLGIGRAAALRKHARPGDREAVRLDAERLDQLHVFLVAVIVLVGAIAIAVVADLAGGVRKRVPDRGPAAVFIDRALDLVGRGRGAPDKALGKGRRREAQLAWLVLLRRESRQRRAERSEAGKLCKVPA